MKKLTVLAHAGDADAIVRRMLHLRCVEIQRTMPEAGELSLERIESDGKQTEIRERMAHIEAAMPRLAKYSTRRGGIGRRVQRLDRAAFVADGRAERAYLAVERTLAVKSRMDEIVAELQKIGTITVDRNMCIICVVGDLDWENVGFEARAMEAMKDIPVRMVSYGGSNYNISFLVREEDKVKALRSLSASIFGTSK